MVRRRLFDGPGESRLNDLERLRFFDDRDPTIFYSRRPNSSYHLLSHAIIPRHSNQLSIIQSIFKSSQKHNMVSN